MDQHKVINFTHAGKMGDMFNCLPILSSYYKSYGAKINLYLAQFPFVEQSVDILKLQDCINDVIITDFTPDHFGCGGQPYVFGPSDSIHLGFRHFPDRCYMQFIAEEWFLAVDWDFVLNLGEWNHEVIDILDFTMLDTNNSLLSNIRKAIDANDVTVDIGCPAMLLHLARKWCTIRCPDSWLYELHRDKVYTLHNDYWLERI